MELVTRRPLVLPVFRNGCWFDDFAVTGASDPGYSLISGAKDKLPYGIRLRATTSTTSALNLPAWYNLKNFELEMIFRLVAGNNTYFMFRCMTNYLYVNLSSDNYLRLLKYTGSATVLAALSGVIATNWQKIGVRANGSVFEVFRGGKRIFLVTDSDVSNPGIFSLRVYGSEAGTAQAEWQYLAIKPL